MTKKIDYQDKYEQLNHLVEEIQSGALSIDETIGKYEEAEKLINELENYLKQTELRIKKITSQTKSS
jgi:exodeoxyribonuclease VII small subunit